MTPLRDFHTYNALLGYQNSTATRFLPTTLFWATKMTPLHGFYAHNALLGYQNDTATRFLCPQRPFGLPK